MFRKVAWFGQDSAQKPARLELLDGQKLLDGCAAADYVVKEAAEPTEPVPIGKEDKSVFPADQLAT